MVSYREDALRKGEAMIEQVLHEFMRIQAVAFAHGIFGGGATEEKPWPQFKPGEAYSNGIENLDAERGPRFRITLRCEMLPEEGEECEAK